MEMEEGGVLAPEAVTLVYVGIPLSWNLRKISR